MYLYANRLECLVAHEWHKVGLYMVLRFNRSSGYLTQLLKSGAFVASCLRHF